MQSERVGGTVRIVPVGELDIATVPEFDQSFDAAIEQAPESIVVDLSQVTFIDSTGLRALLSMSARYQGELGLSVGSPAVERIIDVTGTRGQLPLIDG